MMANDLILSALTVILSLKFRIFAIQFENFAIKLDYSEVKRIVDHHEKLFQDSEKLEKAFTVSNFITFLGSSFLCAFTSFVLITTDKPLTTIKYVTSFAIATLQIFQLCFYGEKLRTSSAKVAAAALSCNWYEIEDLKMKKALQLIVLRSQKKAKLTALQFTNISIETFGNVSLSNFKKLSRV